MPRQEDLPHLPQIRQPPGASSGCAAGNGQAAGREPWNAVFEQEGAGAGNGPVSPARLQLLLRRGRDGPFTLRVCPSLSYAPGRGAAPVPMRLTGMSRLTIMPGSPGRCTGCPRQKNRGRPRTGRFPDKREAVFIRICQRHSSNAGGAGNVPGPGRSRDAAAKKTGEGPSAGIPWKRHEGLLSRELRERARTKPVKCRQICKAIGGGSALCPRFGKTPH